MIFRAEYVSNYRGKNSVKDPSFPIADYIKARERQRIATKKLLEMRERLAAIKVRLDSLG